MITPKYGAFSSCCQLSLLAVGKTAATCHGLINIPSRLTIMESHAVTLCAAVFLLQGTDFPMHPRDTLEISK